MKKNTINITILAVAIAAIFTACVPQRKYAELETRKNQVNEENETLRKSNEQYQSKQKELEATLLTRDEQVEGLKKDSANYGQQYRQLKVQYDKINELNDILSRKSNELLSQATGENQKLALELSKTQEALQKKEDALKVLEKSLNEKQIAIDRANTDLKDREQRLQEMNDLLAAQKAASEALKTKVQNALLSFQDKGLSVYEKEGKVYVSMEAKLLFASGSTAVDPRGRQAIVDLSKAIENEVDMEVIVEGHTDTDKISSNSIPRDNWELSVLRATEVVEIMIANSKIKPVVLSAAGRSEYHPVDATDKAKNRRIEIILQPDLTELYNIIEGKE
jgi:chemotaxis protein MotB